MRKRFWFSGFSFLILALVLSFPAAAHDATLSLTTMQILEDGLHVNYTTPERNILALFPGSRYPYPEYQSYFREKFVAENVLENGARRCEPAIEGVMLSKASSVSLLAGFRCGEISILNTTYGMFFDLSETHENVALVKLASVSGTFIYSKDFKYYEFLVNSSLAKLGLKNATGNETQKAAQNESSASAAISVQTESGGSGVIASFFALGVEHIFTGYDHILFVVGLLVVAATLMQLAKIVTSFTIAHSVTLIAATLGIFVPDPRLTESLIALTIIFIAAENIVILRSGKSGKKRGGNLLHRLLDPSKRWRIGFALGLIHGFGFSSVLRELGLPRENLIPALLSFNLGVEAGQLVIVGVLFPALLYARRKKWNRKAMLWLSAVIGAAGFALLVQKALFV